MKITLEWDYAQGELDTKTMKLLCIPGRGERLFGAFEKICSFSYENSTAGEGWSNMVTHSKKKRTKKK